MKKQLIPYHLYASIPMLEDKELNELTEPQMKQEIECIILVK